MGGNPVYCPILLEHQYLQTIIKTPNTIATNKNTSSVKLAPRMPFAKSTLTSQYPHHLSPTSSDFLQSQFDIPLSITF
ncbi:hypothetical protein SAMN02745866_00534 [Alteromonadaceae bacterium Bs31]|nr:hypothetical protein SAMN02745866_00534 [Alteromonadaceae bacterium Bs31]